MRKLPSPVIIVLFNNGALGMVRQWQTLTCNGRHSQTTLDRGPDFVKLAEAYGLKGCRVTDVAELEAAIAVLCNCLRMAALEKLGV